MVGSPWGLAAMQSGADIFRGRGWTATGSCGHSPPQLTHLFAFSEVYPDQYLASR